ncbi:MAG: Rieske 2Fe-2S domain-containing protein [Acidimicrobiales bacterium]
MSNGDADLPPEAERAARWSAALLVLAIASAVAFVVVYTVDDSIQLEGVLLAVTLLSIGMALAVWAKALLPSEPRVEDRPPLRSDQAQRGAVGQDLDRAGGVGRRPLLVHLAGGALVALAAAIIAPLRSLGPGPGGKAALRTRWRFKVRAVTSDGVPVKADAVPLEGLVTVFPEGATDSEQGQVVLVRVREQALDLPAGRDGWAPNGLVAYSKVCTHAGCPVGLYQAAARTLLCPCHQSSFDVTTGAQPLSGPAAWPLPQLPIEVDGDGFVRSTGDLSAPPGPGWWKE